MIMLLLPMVSSASQGITVFSIKLSCFFVVVEGVMHVVLIPVGYTNSILAW